MILLENFKNILWITPEPNKWWLKSKIVLLVGLVGNIFFHVSFNMLL